MREFQRSSRCGELVEMDLDWSCAVWCYKLACLDTRTSAKRTDVAADIRRHQWRAREHRTDGLAAFIWMQVSSKAGGDPL